MKLGRIIGILLLAILVLYLFLFHAANPGLVVLPWLSFLIPPVPVLYAVILALLIGFVAGWLPVSVQLWRRKRELRRVRRRLEQFESVPKLPSPVDPFAPSETVPVIPDRTGRGKLGTRPGSAEVSREGDDAPVEDPLWDTEAG